MRHKFVFIIVLAFCVCSVHPAWPQNHHLRFNRMIDTGSMLVPGPIIQDHQGFIWLGTQGSGLIKYNGYEIQRFPAGPDTFLDGNVTSLLEDKDGIIWIATLSGLYSYDKYHNTFQSYKHDPENDESISHDGFNPSLQTIYEDRAGKLWFGTQNGLSCLDKTVGAFTRYGDLAGRQSSLSSKNIFSVGEDRSGYVWVGTDKGINRLDTQQNRVTLSDGQSGQNHELMNSTVFVIHEDRDGVIWLGTSSGLYRFNREDDSFTRFAHDPENPQSLPNNSVHSILEDSGDRFWIGHSFQGSGLTLFDKKKRIFTSHRHDPDDSTTLSGDSIMGICRDSSGIIWLANLNGTLDKYDPFSYKFERYVHSADDPHTISDNLVNVTFEDSDGDIWFATDNGLNLFDRERRTFTRYMSHPGDPKSIPGKFVCGPYEDSRKNLWVVSSDNFLSLFDKKNGIVKKTFNVIKFPLVVIEDTYDHDILWITSWGNGLARFNKVSHTTRIFLHDPGDPESISSNNLVDIYQDKTGYIWLPTMGGGLDIFDPLTGKKIKSYTHDPDNPKSIGSDTVSHIFEDSDGIFWASTYGGGLNRFDKENETFQRFTVKEGFPTNTVTNILEDDNHNLWIGSKIGYIRFNTITHESKVFTTDDGLAGNEFQEAGMCRSRDGTFWLATITGGNSFHPGKMKDNPFVPPVYLTSVKQGGQRIGLNTAPENLETIELGWRSNYFEFEFAALNYTNSKQNRHAYRLEGLEQAWNTIGTMRYGRYTNLPGGTFTLHLKGSNNDGIWNEKGTSINVVVEPPPWFRWWAYCLYVSVVLIGVLIVYAYIRTLKREVAERKKAQQDLQKSEAKYRDLIENSPDLRFRTDTNGCIVFISQSIQTLTGYTVQEALGMNITKNLLENRFDGEELIRRLRQDGTVNNFETQMRHKDGSAWWASTNVHYLFDEQNNVLGIEGVTRDVTELKLARDRKEKLEARLMQAQKMEAIGTLAGGIAHDFNNILSGIFGFSQLAENHLNNPDKVKEYLGQIVKGAGKAADLVQQILTFSRQSQQEKVPLQLSLVIKEALKLLRSTIPSTIRIKENIRSDANVLADPIKIHQIVMNLCTNAYHAMQEDGGQLTVALKEESVAAKEMDGRRLPGGSYVRFSVSDTGHGMTADVRDKIFEPYFTTKSQDKGTGLGLAVVLGIVEEHNGYIHVDSVVDEGTRFDIYFPVTDQQAGEVDIKKEEVIPVSGSETILLVDDEKDILSSTKAFLQQYGYKVLTFTDGIKAVEMFRENPDKIDLVITDMTMPVITGDKLSQQILECRPDTPIFLCTGYSHKISKEAALAMGISRYIPKPVILTDLIQAVRKTLDERHDSK